MGTSNKKVILIVCIAIILFSVAFGSIRIVQHVSYQRELRAEEAEQRRIAETYLRLNYAFWLGGVGDLERFGIEWALQFDGEYLPFRELNEFGVRISTYLILKKYELETGNTLSFETVLEYFSQEFEPDGSLRLYNNGKHPEIQAFVEWMWEGMRLSEMSPFIVRIGDVYNTYYFENRDEGFQWQNIFHMSPQMLDALFRAYTDPNYVLDLTSLQQAGY